MSLNLEQKKEIVAEIAAVAAKAPTAIAAEYSGLNVSQLTQLRQSARKSGIFLKVVRNTLARRALEGTAFECMRDGLVGPLVLAFSGDEPGAAARVIREFGKANEKLVVKLVAMDGRLLAVSDLDRVANLPTLDQARSIFLGVLKAPVGKFVRVLAEPEAKFARVLAARRDQQQAA